jgi:hypothetical protein
MLYFKRALKKHFSLSDYKDFKKWTSQMSGLFQKSLQAKRSENFSFNDKKLLHFKFYFVIYVFRGLH